jgi:hypothetical protein
VLNFLQIYHVLKLKLVNHQCKCINHEFGHMINHNSSWLGLFCCVCNEILSILFFCFLLCFSDFPEFVLLIRSTDTPHIREIRRVPVSDTRRCWTQALMVTLNYVIFFKLLFVWCVMSLSCLVSVSVSVLRITPSFLFVCCFRIVKSN